MRLPAKSTRSRAWVPPFSLDEEDPPRIRAAAAHQSRGCGRDQRASNGLNRAQHIAALLVYKRLELDDLPHHIRLV